MSAFTSKAQNIAKLPGQCRNGYLCKVSNTEDSSADDYYVKFEVSSTIDLWKNSTAYSVGDKVINDNRVYVCDDAGTSHASNTGPSGTGNNQTDGGARWDFDSNLSGAGT